MGGLLRIFQIWYSSGIQQKIKDLLQIKCSQSPAERCGGSVQKGQIMHGKQRQEDRAFKGSGCPYCAGQRASVTNSLATLYPNAASQWHPTKNENLTPDKVPAGSQKKAWWKCPNINGHVARRNTGDRNSIKDSTSHKYLE